jgi:hypothetical protein
MMQTRYQEIFVTGIQTTITASQEARVKQKHHATNTALMITAQTEAAQQHRKQIQTALQPAIIAELAEQAVALIQVQISGMIIAIHVEAEEEQTGIIAL